MDRINCKVWGPGHKLRNNQDVRVLVVDDDENGGGALAAYLNLEDMEARAVKSCDEALTVCAAWQPDITVLDIMMPVYDGFHTARELRKRFDRDLAIVAYTATDSVFVRANPAGALFDAYCQKGTAPAHLVKFLYRLLEKEDRARHGRP
ncbi:Response regulator receiver protein [Paraburkholderia sabiae]|nr:response regulator [Paraburkholderia sabiae]CAG9225847.1 Response regulator receiver protein [Paraburkholderia sabiae]